MPTKTKVRHRVTFAPDTKNETEQLDCLVRAIEFKGPGIDELSNMIQNIHIGYTENKRKPSFDSSSIIAQLRNTLDSMLDSELAENSVKSSSSDCGSLKDEVTSKEDTTLSKPTLDTIEENNEKQFKASHDSGVSDIEFELEKMKNNEVSPQARRRVSGLINKLDTCINELQRVTDTIEEETPSEVQACLNDVKETGKEALPTKVDGNSNNLSLDTNVNTNANVNNLNSTGNALFSEPMDAGYYTANTSDYLYNEQDMNNYSLNSTEDMTRLDLVRKGIYAIPNQPTVIEACYSGFLLSSILTVVADDCSVLYFGILTENNLYFYNSTDDNEPMFGRIVIDQNTKVVPISSHDNQGYLIEINGIYVLPDNQFINSKVRIKFNSKQERNIWYKVIKTTVNDWKIRTSYNNNPNQTKTDGRKRRLSFLSSIQLQPLYLENTPKRSDSLHRNEDNSDEMKPASKKASESTVVSPNDENITSTNTTNNSPPNSASTITPEESYNINPSQSILSALHVLEALERKRTIQ
jgi:hypothetical protein